MNQFIGRMLDHIRTLLEDTGRRPPGNAGCSTTEEGFIE
jgi:hypothetical protein